MGCTSSSTRNLPDTQDSTYIEANSTSPRGRPYQKYDPASMELGDDDFRTIGKIGPKGDTSESFGNVTTIEGIISVEVRNSHQTKDSVDKLEIGWKERGHQESLDRQYALEIDLQEKQEQESRVVLDESFQFVSFDFTQLH